MCRYFCFRFINFMLKRKRLLNSSILYGVVRTFWIQKIRQEQLTKFINIFELYQVFMYNFYNFLCQIVLIFPIYIYIYIYIYISIYIYIYTYTYIYNIYKYIYIIYIYILFINIHQKNQHIFV